MTPKVHAALLALVSMTANAPECLLGSGGSSLAGAASGEADDAAPQAQPGEAFAATEGSDITGDDIAQWLNGEGSGQRNQLSPERTAWSQFEFSTLDLSYEVPTSFRGAGPYVPDDTLFASQQTGRALSIGPFLAGSLGGNGGGGGGGAGGAGGGGGGKTADPISGSPIDSGGGPTADGDAGTPVSSNPAGPAGSNLPGDDLPGDDLPDVNDDSPPTGSLPSETSVPPETLWPPEDSLPTDEPPVSVPEPATLGMFGLGLLGLGLFRRRRGNRISRD